MDAGSSRISGGTWRQPETDTGPVQVYVSPDIPQKVKDKVKV